MLIDFSGLLTVLYFDKLMEMELIYGGSTIVIQLSGIDVTVTHEYQTKKNVKTKAHTSKQSAKAYYYNKITQLRKKGYSIKQCSADNSELYQMEISKHTAKSSKLVNAYCEQFEGEYLISSHGRYYAIMVEGPSITIDEGKLQNILISCDTNSKAKHKAIRLMEAKVAVGYWRESMKYKAWKADYIQQQLAKNDSENLENSSHEGTEIIESSYDSIITSTIEDLDKRYG